MMKKIVLLVVICFICTLSLEAKPDKKLSPFGREKDQKQRTELQDLLQPFQHILLNAGLGLSSNGVETGLVWVAGIGYPIHGNDSLTLKYAKAVSDHELCLIYGVPIQTDSFLLSFGGGVGVTDTSAYFSQSPRIVVPIEVKGMMQLSRHFACGVTCQMEWGQSVQVIAGFQIGDPFPLHYSPESPSGNVDSHSTK